MKSKLDLTALFAVLITALLAEPLSAGEFFLKGNTLKKSSLTTAPKRTPVWTQPQKIKPSQDKRISKEGLEALKQPAEMPPVEESCAGIQYIYDPFSPNAEIIAHAVALQTDGNLIIGGKHVDQKNAMKGFVSRHSALGQPSAAFGDNGTTILPFIVNDVAVQTDGTILAAGTTSITNNYDFYLARLDGNGVLDSTFGNGGIISTDSNGYSNQANALTIAGNGTIFLAGGVIGNNPDFEIARYASNGTLEANSRTDFGSNTDEAYAVVSDSSGDILVGGRAGVGFFKAALVRYKSQDLSLDTNFGNQGKVLTDFSKPIDRINDLAIDDSGRIVAAGWTCLGDEECQVAVARYQSNGSLDTTFGNGGWIEISIAHPSNPNITSSRSEAIAIQNDGKIVVVGYIGNVLDFAVLRLDSNGSLDPTFGNNGSVITQFGYREQANDVAILPDGSLVVVGLSYNPMAHSFLEGAVAVARYKANGDLYCP